MVVRKYLINRKSHKYNHDGLHFRTYAVVLNDENSSKKKKQQQKKYFLKTIDLIYKLLRKKNTLSEIKILFV